MSGQTVLLTSVESKSRLRVGKYGVELATFEDFLRAEPERPASEVDLFVVDEIGKMECFSEVFVQAMRRILHGDIPLLATIAMKGGFIEEVKERDDVELVTVPRNNRDTLPDDWVARFRCT